MESRSCAGVSALSSWITLSARCWPQMLPRLRPLPLGASWATSPAQHPITTWGGPLADEASADRTSQRGCVRLSRVGRPARHSPRVRGAGRLLSTAGRSGCAGCGAFPPHAAAVYSSEISLRGGGHTYRQATYIAAQYRCGWSVGRHRCAHQQTRMHAHRRPASTPASAGCLSAAAWCGPALNRGFSLS
jgi:hypothetical protein